VLQGPDRPGWPKPNRPAGAARRRAALFLVAGVAVALAGCVSSAPRLVTDGSQPATRAPGLGQATQAGPAADTTPAPVSPLTGMPASAAAAARPAVALVVSGPNPVGLASADVVFEEISTPAPRYIAVFQSQNAANVGPVTSTSPADGMVLSVLHPLTGYDGGSVGFLEVLHSTKIIDVGFAGHSSLYRAGPGGLTTSTAAIGQAGRDTAPPPLFQYQGVPGLGDQLASAGIQRISALRVVIPGGPTQTWAYDSRASRWALTSGGPHVLVSNLVVQDVAYKQVFLSHRYQITVPSARVIGSGRMLAVSGVPGSTQGAAASGTWSKPGPGAVTNFLDAADLPMAFRPGPTWIILAPKGTLVETG
jgi:Protein of unknown function (DUF3048) N-terminal domain/Protein of unknown function (DUF3048) C-terminal domain